MGTTESVLKIVRLMPDGRRVSSYTQLYGWEREYPINKPVSALRSGTKLMAIQDTVMSQAELEVSARHVALWPSTIEVWRAVATGTHPVYYTSYQTNGEFEHFWKHWRPEKELPDEAKIKNWLWCETLRLTDKIATFHSTLP